MSNDEPQTPGERLKWARQRAGFESAIEFARAAKVGEIAYRAYENDQNGFKKHVVTFSRRLGVPIEWLLEGGELPSGRPPKLGEVETPQHLADYGIDVVRRVDISYAMGDGAIIADYPETGFMPFERQFLKSITRASAERLIVANGEGDSMNPTIFDNDLVLIDTSSQRLAMQDRIWALVVAGAGMIKRLRVLPGQRVLVLSDNSAVPPQEFDADDIHLVGRVVWIGRRV